MNPNTFLRIVLAFIVCMLIGLCFSSCAELGQFAQSPEGQRLMRTVENEAVRALDSQLYAQPSEDGR